MENSSSKSRVGAVGTPALSKSGWPEQTLSDNDAKLSTVHPTPSDKKKKNVQRCPRGNALGMGGRATQMLSSDNVLHQPQVILVSCHVHCALLLGLIQKSPPSLQRVCHWRLDLVN